MKSALCSYFKHTPVDQRYIIYLVPWKFTLMVPYRGKLRVLVPGAGLGRLAWDVASLGMIERRDRSWLRVNVHCHRIFMSRKRVLPLHAISIFLYP